MKTKTNTKMTVRHFLHCTFTAALLCAGRSAWAGDAGHFNGGLMDIRDYFVPPDPGFYGGVYNYFYNSSRFNDQSGNKVSSITVNPGPGPGIPLNVNVDLNMYALVPAVIWVSPWNVLGAKYGAYIAPTFANASIQGTLDTLRGRGGTASQSSFGVGDMYVQPVWLDWSLPHWDFVAAYGFYAPIGKYDTETVTFPLNRSWTVPSSSNIGLGFWTQEFQAAAAWYPWTNRATAVTAVLTYEHNSQQWGTQTTPGQNLWFNWGISQYLPLTKDEKLLLEVGPAGYYEWQVSDSTGPQVTDPGARTGVGAIGGQLGVTYVPWNLVLNFRGMYEYYANDRVQGTSFSINLIKKF